RTRRTVVPPAVDSARSAVSSAPPALPAKTSHASAALRPHPPRGRRIGNGRGGIKAASAAQGIRLVDGLPGQVEVDPPDLSVRRELAIEDALPCGRETPQVEPPHDATETEIEAMLQTVREG